MNLQPGWFPDPSDSNVEVYFDGERWTGEKRSRIQNSETLEKSREISFSLPIRPDLFNKKRILIGAGVLVFAIAGSIFANVQSENAAKEARAQAAIERAEKEAAEVAAAAKKIQAERADYSWVPSGFTKFSVNNNLAYKGISYDAADCYSNCFGMQVVSRDYCSSLSIEANIERNNVILDTDSDYATGIPAGTRTVMKITSSASLPWSVIFTEAKCT